MSHDAEMDAALARIGVLRLRLDDAEAENARLKAEVERLRKAGDLLCFHYISLARKRWPNDPLPSSVTDWNAAKEGKQS